MGRSPSGCCYCNFPILLVPAFLIHTNLHPPPPVSPTPSLSPHPHPCKPREHQRFNTVSPCQGSDKLNKAAEEKPHPPFPRSPYLLHFLGGRICIYWLCLCCCHTFLKHEMKTVSGDWCSVKCSKGLIFIHTGRDLCNTMRSKEPAHTPSFAHASPHPSGQNSAFAAISNSAIPVPSCPRCLSQPSLLYVSSSTLLAVQAARLLSHIIH